MISDWEKPWEPTIDLRFERRIDGVRIVSILQRRFMREVTGYGVEQYEHEWRDIPVVDSDAVKALDNKVTPSCGCVFCDLDLALKIEEDGTLYHPHPNGTRSPCTWKPRNSLPTAQSVKS